MDLIFWVITDSGAKKLIFTHQKPVFFVLQKKQKAVEKLLKSCLPISTWFIKPLELLSFSSEKICGVYFNQQRNLYTARKQLREQGIEAYESDITPTDRFLMERFITGGVEFTSENNNHALSSCYELTNPKIGPCDFQPHYKVLSLDIETSLHGDKLYSIGFVCSTSQMPEDRVKYVYMINSDDNPIKHNLNYLHFFNSEAELLIHFLKTFAEFNPDIIIGWNVINFDLRFLQRKADQLKQRFSLGREDGIVDWRESRNDSQHFTLTIPGRLVLDGIDTLKSATHSFESFSLEYVSNQVIGRGKLIHKDHDRGLEISRLFDENKPALASYNLEDCELVWEIFNELDLIQFAVERAHLTGLAMDRFGGSVAAFDNRYLPRLHRKGYIAPLLPQNPQNVGSPGGYVMESTPGIYNHVVVLDFKSLYPSIIQTFKVDPLGLLKGDQLISSTSLSKTYEIDAESENNDPSEFVAGYNGALFSKREHILPELIQELWQARDQAKLNKNHANSQAIKILMNSFYGVLGTPGCRFFNHRLPSSITLRGHSILEMTKNKIEQRGLKVIYGDTDSVFVWLKGYHPNIATETLNSLGKDLASELNQWFTEYLYKSYGVKNHLELEFETHFTRFIMPTIRGSDRGTKKRYAGLRVTQGDNTELVFKGLENVRTDWTQAARKFQQELYQRIFHNKPYADFIRSLVADIYQGKLDSELSYRKRIRRKLSDYQKNVPPHVQAARLAERQRQKQNLPIRYKRGSWIEYFLTTQGPEPVEYKKYPMDYDLYIERQIKPIADGILHFLGDSFDSICSKQINLL